MSFNWINKFLQQSNVKVFCVCMWREVTMVEEALIRRLYSCRWLAAFCFWHIRLSHNVLHKQWLYSLRYQWRKSHWSKNDTFFLFLLHSTWTSSKSSFSDLLMAHTAHIASIQNFFFPLPTAPAAVAVAVSGLCFMSLSLRWKIDSFD